MKIYFNIKTNYGTETVDELLSSDFKTIKEYKKEKRKLLKECSVIYPNVYLSKRCCKDWNN